MDINFINFVKNHPTMTLEEYVAFESAKEQEYINNIKEKERKHLQWIKDNLCNKKVIFRMNSAFRILSFEYDAKNDNIVTHTHYEFYSVEQSFYNDEFKNSKRFRFDNLEQVKTNSFNLNWIKSPYNTDMCAKSAYIMNDVDFECMKHTFASFEEYYKGLLDFENNTELATKVY